MKKLIAIITIFCFFQTNFSWSNHPKPNQKRKTDPPAQEQTQGQPPPKAKKTKYQRFDYGKDGILHEIHDSNLDVYTIPCLLDKKGKPIAFDVYIIDKSDPKQIHRTITVYDVKITHWGKTVRTLGIAAAVTTSVGLLVFWAPGVILAAAPY